MTESITELIAVTLDSADAERLATFYADLTGGKVTGVYPDYGYASAEVLGQTFNFQTVAGYTAPQWPGQEHPQQSHLDFRVDDLEAATAHAVSLGAAVAQDPADGLTWRVMTDPDGHPFCLCPPQQ